VCLSGDDCGVSLFDGGEAMLGTVRIPLLLGNMLLFFGVAAAQQARSQPPPEHKDGAAPKKNPVTAALFKKYCQSCHGSDGKGKKIDGLVLPNFTSPAWQKSVSDARLVASILNGKGNDMPPFEGRLTEKQVKKLAAHVRSFDPTKGAKSKPKDATAQSFVNEYESLEKEWQKLEKEFHALAKSSQAGMPVKPAKSPKHQLTGQAAMAAANGHAVHELFRQRCTKCHGADGTGSPVRSEQPKIPDFTLATWQAQRSDAQLKASILGGKGPKMPPWRDKISPERTRDLVAYIRSFPDKTGQYDAEEQEESTSRDPAADEPRTGFVEKLIHWLGNFHPPAVNFPIALLSAAALAEILRLFTHRPAFDGIARYCLWVGTLGAVNAVVLGWFLAGFHFTDEPWMVAIHRWLGTSTMVGAAAVLGLCELSRRPGRRRTRLCFRGALFFLAALVLITGFFGGAVVFGLDHYAWPG
jgi:mono/diheme cytochrome c family protein/uncharacterized membrane protein